MVDAATVRRLALALPEVVETSRGGDHIAFEVAGGKGLAWTFMLRVHPKRARVPDPTGLAVRCPIERREMLVAAARPVFRRRPLPRLSGGPGAPARDRRGRAGRTVARRLADVGTQGLARATARLT
jgi:hypothetical protein